MRCFTLISLILILSIPVGQNCFSQEKTSITRVVIDAGHGGKDPGTIGKKSQEKNIALQVALKLAEEIRKECKGVTVICTRTTDEFIELHERAEIANRSKADLFISIHCNANPKHTFHGAETYIMGLHRTEANLEIAKLENAAILMEPDYSVNYNGFDPNSDESYITFTLFQNAYLEQSTRFASYVQDEMKDRVGMDDRGVRQAGFLVLYKTTMPSVLIETGFLSNPEEEKFLISQKGQEYISGAICRAFRRFKAKLEGNGKEMAALNTSSNTHPAGKENPPKEPSATEQKETKPDTKSPVKDSATPPMTGKETSSLKDTGKTEPNPGVKPAVKDSLRPKEKANGSSSPAGGVKPKPASAKKIPPANTAKPKEPTEKTQRTDTVNRSGGIAAKTGAKETAPVKPGVKPSAKPKEIPARQEAAPPLVVFRVQVATSSKELSVHSKKFEGLPQVWKYQHQGLYKYTIGREISLEAIAPVLEQAKSKGYSDAFIVAFRGSERITVAEAKKLLSDGEK
jgi:N-acetylmuramoyl-L-alanine amidase